MKGDFGKSSASKMVLPNDLGRGQKFFKEAPQRVWVGGVGGDGLRGLGGSPRRELKGFRRGDRFFGRGADREVGLGSWPGFQRRKRERRGV